MTELARGGVTDRPWGMTMGALGLRGLTGQLVLAAEGKRYQIAFSAGAVVGATSPLASDAAVRIAMTGGLLSSTQVADIARRQQANPQRDEVELIAELTRLTPEQALKLRRRVIAQRAARTFSLQTGDFIVDDRITLPVVPGAELDIRSVIFLGARSNLSENRLGAELEQFGNWFQLLPDAVFDLPQYGFSRTEDPVLDILEAGAALTDLETMGELHVVRAMVYALASCNALAAETRALPRPHQTAPQPTPPTRPKLQPQQPPSHGMRTSPTPPQGIHPPIPQPIPPSPSQGMRQAIPQAQSSQSYQQPAIARTASQQRTSQVAPVQRPDHGFDPPTMRRGDALGDGATIRRPSPIDTPTSPRQPAKPSRTHRTTSADPVQAHEVTALIKKHSELLKKRSDHFTLLGTTFDASPEDVRNAYFSLARHLHPDRLSALGIPDDNKAAQRLFAEVNTAFAVVSEPKSRQEYTSILKRGGAAAIAADQARAEAMATRIVEAEEAFRRGEGALRRDQLATAVAEFARAIELNPEEVDFVAFHTWALFCSSPDKMAIASATRTTLDRTISKSPRAVMPRFLLGRVERMLGRDADALRHFQEVLQLQPHHTEAASEARMIEQRLAAPKKR